MSNCPSSLQDREGKCQILKNRKKLVKYFHISEEHGVSAFKGNNLDIFLKQFFVFIPESWKLFLKKQRVLKVMIYGEKILKTYHSIIWTAFTHIMAFLCNYGSEI